MLKKIVVNQERLFSTIRADPYNRDIKTRVLQLLEILESVKVAFKKSKNHYKDPSLRKIMSVINISDLYQLKPRSVKPRTLEEREIFLARVRETMDRLGVTEANERTRRSEVLTAEDYAVFVGPQNSPERDMPYIRR